MKSSGPARTPGGSGCEAWCELLFEPEESLSPEHRRELSQHLKQCPECQEERDLFLESWEALDTLEPELEPSPLLRAQVWEKIRENGYTKESPNPFGPFWLKVRPWKRPLLQMTAAAAALLIGFGLGRSVRNTPPGEASNPSVAQHHQELLLDQSLLELASQDGFSLELFPETSQFSPLDREMMSALATTTETKEWLHSESETVLPLQYIGQNMGD